MRDVVRRGKFLWLELDSGEGLLAHLGMSGQLLLQPPGAAAERHLRVRVRLRRSGAAEAEGRELASSTSGCSAACGRAARADSGRRPGGRRPGRRRASAGPVGRHIARDPLDPTLDEKALVRWRATRTGVKRALLDQTLLSGVGNIYADEALWRARLHYARPTDA